MNIPSILRGIHMVADIESVGLHGEPFAIGYVILEDGHEVDSQWRSCPMDYYSGSLSHQLPEDVEWVKKNVPEEVRAPKSGDEHYMKSNIALQEWFWQEWMKVRDNSGSLWADCCWPVETNFLSRCINRLDQFYDRKWKGPYPLYDISTVRSIIEHIFGKTLMLRTNQCILPEHHPMADARFSARQLVVYAKQLEQLKAPGEYNVG